jgi:hypothetical protein
MVRARPRRPTPREPDEAARPVIANADEARVRELPDHVLDAVIGGGGPIAPARLADLLRHFDG